MKADRLKYKFTVLGSIVCFFQLLFLLTGCVDESLEPCPSSDEDLLYFSVWDVLSDRMTGTDDIENMTLYLFDSEKRFLESLDIPVSQVDNHTPLDLRGRGAEDGYAVVWANINDLVTLQESARGELISEFLISKKADEAYPDYHLCASDLFYGYKQLDRHVSVKEMEIKRKNGGLHITVQGFKPDSDPDDYFFKVCLLNSGYDFEGVPLKGQSNVRGKGEFTGEFSYELPLALMLIHSSPDDEKNEDNCITVHLMKADKNLRAGEKELIAVNKDVEGNFITVESGQVTNILIQINESGQFTVYMKITPWNEVYQWSEW